MALETSAGQEAQNPEATETEQKPAPQYVTVEDFNRALNGFAKKFEKTLQKSTAQQPVQVETAEEQRSQRKQSDPEVERLRAENAQFKAFYEEYKRDKAEALKREREARLDSALSSELERIGVAPSAMKDAKASLRFYNTVRFESDESEDIVFGLDDEPMPLPLREGIKQWSKSASAARFMPPSGVKGSGDNGGYTTRTGNSTNGDKLSPSEVAKLVRLRSP